MNKEESQINGKIIEKFSDFEEILNLLIEEYENITSKFNILIIDKNFFNNIDDKIHEEIKNFIVKIKSVNSNNNLYWLISKKYNFRSPNKVNNLTLLYPKYKGTYFHDRFIFIFDSVSRSYLAKLHIGHSINGFYNKNDFDIFRVSEINDEEKDKVMKIVKNLYNFNLETI